MGSNWRTNRGLQEHHQVTQPQPDQGGDSGSGDVGTETIGHDTIILAEYAQSVADRGKSSSLVVGTIFLNHPQDSSDTTRNTTIFGRERPLVRMRNWVDRQGF